MSNSSSIQWAEVFSIKSIIFLLLGTLFAVVAIKGFMIPNHFLDGGCIGLAILIHEIFHIDISLPLLLLNLPFIYLGYKKIGKTFAVQSTIAVLLTILFLNVIQIPTITTDKILIAVFGGVFIGLGIGFVIRAGGVIDGLEVVADYTHKKAGLSTGEIILAINSAIFLTAAFILGIEKAMYSILTYFTAVQVSKYVVDGFEEYTALTIVSGMSEEIKSLIVNDFSKAISIYKGERGYLPGSFEVAEDCDIIVAVATRLELFKLKKTIYKLDPKAFLYAQSIKEVRGGVVKKIRNH